MSIARLIALGAIIIALAGCGSNGSGAKAPPSPTVDPNLSIGSCLHSETGRMPQVVSCTDPTANYTVYYHYIAGVTSCPGADDIVITQLGKSYCARYGQLNASANPT